MRKSIVDRVGLPLLQGADDSAFGSYIAFAGYRAIQVDDAWTYEPVTEKQYKRMIRRATHLIIYFLKLKHYAKQRGVYRKTEFDKIWRIESYLHLFNPITLPLATALLLASAFQGSITALTLILLGVILLTLKPYRTWIMNQLYLLIALLRSLKTKEETWTR